MTDLPEHVWRNRARWDQWALEYERPGHHNWASDEPVWMIWGVPESQVQKLPDDVDGLDVIELGCGTAYVSAWHPTCCPGRPDCRVAGQRCAGRVLLSCWCAP